MTSVGRPKSFDREEALRRAMELFWERGYEATGLQDLLEHMQIGRQSLYDTFGDKRSLYIEAVQHYSHCITQQIVDSLDAKRSPVENIRTTLLDLAKPASDAAARGCLLTNTLVEMAPHDPEIAKTAQFVLSRIENAFRRCLQRAVDEGELPADTRVRQLARFFTSNVQGLMVMGKASTSRAALKDIALSALSVL